MTSSYQLVDFGRGCKLESFGDSVVQRPSPYADSVRAARRNWNPDLTFRNSGWIGQQSESDWIVSFDDLSFHLKPTPVGHLGIFPEQQANWNWMRQSLGEVVTKSKEPLRALNLFAYTGGSTFALAKLGVHVAHVDGAANTVKWARRNAELNRLESAPIRWLAEDALKFVRREIKRGNQYDILVADPPSFGRGPKKEQWRIERDLPELFEAIQLLLPKPTAILISCHTPGITSNSLSDMLSQSFPDIQSGTTTPFTLCLKSVDGRELESGECVRWIRY